MDGEDQEHGPGPAPPQREEHHGDRNHAQHSRWATANRHKAARATPAVSTMSWPPPPGRTGASGLRWSTRRKQLMRGMPSVLVVTGAWAWTSRPILTLPFGRAQRMPRRSGPVRASLSVSRRRPNPDPPAPFSTGQTGSRSRTTIQPTPTGHRGTPVGGSSSAAAARQRRTLSTDFWSVRRQDGRHRRGCGLRNHTAGSLAVPAPGTTVVITIVLDLDDGVNGPYRTARKAKCRTGLSPRCEPARRLETSCPQMAAGEKTDLQIEAPRSRGRQRRQR